MKTEKRYLQVIAALMMLNLAVCLLVGCSQKQSNPITPKDTGYCIGDCDHNLRSVVIDGCEYLYGPWGNATVLTHKGNCTNHSNR